MVDIKFLSLLFVAMVAFGWALTWVMAQWLRSDDAADRAEREVQLRLKQLNAEPVQIPPEAPDSPEDKALISALWWCTTLGTVGGMIVGGAWAQFLGVFLGAIVGSVVGAAIGVLVAEVGKRARVAEAAQAQGTSEAPTDAHTEEVTIEGEPGTDAHNPSQGYHPKSTPVRPAPRSAS